jgi:2,3-bisphosphoglycerate-independent phosphoglycerate mutase
MKKMPDIKKILPMAVIVLDGWGISNNKKGNAIKYAKTPRMNEIYRNYPHTQLYAHGKYVGLPDSPPQVGNSEAGHMNIGAGRVVEQDSVRINKSINNGTFYKNPAFLEVVRHVKKNNSTLHLMGVVSAGMCPHSYNKHIHALLELTRRRKVKKVCLHLFTDGRDSPRYEGIKIVEDIQSKLRENEQIVTIMGRFYAMDRKKEWSRTKKAYQALTGGQGRVARNTSIAITSAYTKGESDEFIKPTIIDKKKNKKNGRINDNDGVIFFNLRSDRTRQLSKSFVQKDFKQKNPNAFRRRLLPKNLKFATMTDFGPDLDHILTAYPGIDIYNALPLALKELSQVYMAESEKYAHVTYFLNGGFNSKVNGEEYYGISSPNVDAYDKTPLMRSKELAEQLLKYLKQNKYEFSFVNFAAPDMVGHTGNLKAAIECCEKIDGLIGKIVSEYLKKGGTVIITADHGNVEEMINRNTGRVETRHSINQVPFIIINKELKKNELKKNGKLADVAPTILDLCSIKKPCAMAGKSLIKKT